MTTDEAVRETAARLAAINWERHGYRTWSRSALLKEYLRRAARWADALGCTSQWPFFDIAGCVDPAVHADPEQVEWLLTRLTEAKAGWNVVQVAPFILRWAALPATSLANFSHLEDPFEPLMLMFERDGGFHTEQGGVNVEYKTVRLRTPQEHLANPPMTRFDAAALDRMDAEGSVQQFGYVMGPDD